MKIKEASKIVGDPWNLAGIAVGLSVNRST